MTIIDAKEEAHKKYLAAKKLAEAQPTNRYASFGSNESLFLSQMGVGVGEQSVGDGHLEQYKSYVGSEQQRQTTQTA